ncbi:major allergen Pyr c 1 [Artemisia annua]|uniref:Major allergen Pyr c 1 n=1 Tax=Artemisia annua TaxID=35608 RepID=A0A2U1L7K2_ARTAN|nr:major allergen Pyr c 1 [Artemisia annua]
MGVFAFSSDFTSPVPASRLFKALILDAHNLYPKITPLGIKSIETIEGDGGPGSIEQINFTIDGQVKYVKHRVDALDKEKLVYAYTLIEGGEVSSDNIESIEYVMKFESSPNGGCIGNKTSKYHTKDGFEIKEEDFEKGRVQAFGAFKAIEAFLLENTNAYV